MNHTLTKSVAAYLTLPLVALALFTFGSASGGDSAIGATRIVQATAAIAAMTAPVLAGIGAWEASRIRRSNLDSLGVARTQLEVVRRSLAPTIFAGWFVTLVIQLARARAFPSSLPLLLEFLLPYLIVVSATLAGFALGQRLHGAFAIPVAVVGTWLLTVYPIAIEPLWIRHLTGYTTSCCSVETVLSWRAVTGAAMVALGIAVAGALLASTREALRVFAAAVGLGLVLAAASYLVSDLGSEATQARPTTDLECVQEEASGVELCLWPEHKQLRGMIDQASDEIRTSLARRQLAPPAKLTEGFTSSEAWIFGTYRDATSSEIDTALVVGLLPELPPCIELGEYPAGVVTGVMALVVADYAGKPEAFALMASEDDVIEAERVLELSEAKQTIWFESNIAAIATCDTNPVMARDLS